MFTYVLGILMVTMAAQAAFGWFQIKRMYQSIEDLKKAYRYTPNSSGHRNCKIRPDLPPGRYRAGRGQ